MGYSLAIGEAQFENVEEYYGEDEWYASIAIRVKPEHHDNAPAFDEPTDYTNERWPSYSSWWDFAEFTNLKHVLFDDKDIRGGHPGHHLVTERFKNTINEVFDAYMIEYPDAVATYGDFEEHPENGMLCKFTWLKYWVNWAYENCERPVFTNT